MTASRKDRRALGIISSIKGGPSRRRTVVSLLAALLLTGGENQAAAQLFSGYVISAPPGGQVSTLTLSNSGSSETPMWSKFFGHSFPDNDTTGMQLIGGNPTYPIFKSGSTVLPYSMSVAPTYWASGRLKHAQFCLLLGGNVTIGGSGTSTISINQSNNTSLPSASSRSLSDFSAANLNHVVTLMDGGSGTYTSSLNDGISSAFSDNYVWLDGPAGKIWRIRASYKSGGTPEGGLENYWYVASMQDSSGAFGGIQFQSCATIPWADAAQSLRVLRTFSQAQLNTGASLIRDNVTYGRTNSQVFTWSSGATFSAPSNVFESWQAARLTTTGTLPTGLNSGTTYWIYTGTYYQPPDATFNISSDLTTNFITPTGAGSGTHTVTVYPWVTCYGRIFFCGTTGEWDYVQGGGTIAPITGTVFTNIQIQVDRDYLRKTLTVPSYDFGAPVTSGSATPFYVNTNCGLTNNPDSGGIDEHIGIMPTPFVRHIYTQALVDERNVRAIGLAGGQINSNLRLQSNGGNIICFNKGTNGSGTPYSGMGSCLYTSRFGSGAGSSNAFQPNNAISYNNLTGQTYADGSHKTAYTYYPYIVTGSPEYLEMIMEAANCPIGGGYVAGGATNTRINTTNYAPFGTAALDGSNQGSRIVTTSGVTRYGIFMLTASCRQDAWQLRDMGGCSGILPKNYPQCAGAWTYFRDVIADNAAFVNACLALLPSYAASTSLFYPNAGVYFEDIWQGSYWLSASSLTYGLNGDPNWLTAINRLIAHYDYIINTFGVGMIGSEEWLVRASGGDGPLITSDNQFAMVINNSNMQWVNGSQDFTFVTSTTWTPTIGDAITFTSPDPPSALSTPIPAVCTAFAQYYIVGASNVGANYTVQLSATPGGSALTNTDTSSRPITIWAKPSLPFTNVGSNGVSDYPTVAYRSMLMAKSRGATLNSGTQAIMAAVVPPTSAYGSVPTYCFSASV